MDTGHEHTGPALTGQAGTKHSWRKRLLAATCGGTVMALAAGGVAMATTPSATSNATKPVAAKTAPPSTGGQLTRGDVRAKIVWLARHTVHADLIVDTAKGYKTIDIDRGKLASVSSSQISIVRPDGPTVSATIGSTTRFPGLPESKLTSGDRVVLVQTSSNAIVVWARPPA